VQVDPIKPKLKPPGTQRLKLKCDVMLSIYACKFNLRRYNVAALEPPPAPADPRVACDSDVRNPLLVPLEPCGHAYAADMFRTAGTHACTTVAHSRHTQGTPKSHCRPGTHVVHSWQACGTPLAHSAAG
jgi:hypothetical protein